MKILFLAHSQNSATGIGRLLSSLASNLKKIDQSISVSTYGHDNGLPRNKYALLWHVLKLRRLAKQNDILNALDGWPYGVLAALATIGLKTKLVITGVGTGAVKPLHESWLKKTILHWAYRRAQALTAISSYTKDEILKKCSDLKITVINLGAEQRTDEISDKTPEQVLAQKPYILSVGTFKKRKGYFYSLQAFEKIARDFPELKYVIIGRGPSKKKLEDQIDQAGLKDRVRFFEGLDEFTLKEFYRNAELFILLSQNANYDIEGFGLVFLEAAVFGTPCIGTRESGARDAILNSETGFLVAQNESQEAASKMKEILSDPALKEKLGRQAIAFAKTKTWDATAEEYARIYNSLLAAK